MIGTKYTSDMLAAFAKSPRLRRMDVKVEPDGREIAFYSRRYEKVAVRRHAVADALQAVFNVHGEDPDAVKAESVVLPAGSAVELDVAVSEYGFTSVVEWLHTKSNVSISFYENETSDDPWLRICEPA